MSQSSSGHLDPKEPLTLSESLVSLFLYITILCGNRAISFDWLHLHVDAWRNIWTSSRLFQDFVMNLSYLTKVLIYERNEYSSIFVVFRSLVFRIFFKILFNSYVVITWYEIVCTENIYMPRYNGVEILIERCNMKGKRIVLNKSSLNPRKLSSL